jgi:Na+-driven multidrug efflux pump
MTSEIQTTAGNPLGYEKTGKLLRKFAIPSVVSMLVNSLYNIVDQIFIGRGSGISETLQRMFHFLL